MVAFNALLFFQFVFFNKILKDSAKIRITNLLKIVVNPCVGFVYFDQTVQVNWCANNNRITFGIVYGFFKIL